MEPKKIAIIGDRFMKTEIFREHLEKTCGNNHLFKELELPWPDEPMEHGYEKQGMAGLKEYMGDPDEIVSFIGDSEIVVDILLLSRQRCLTDSRPFVLSLSLVGVQ